MGAYVKRKFLEEAGDDLLSSHILGLKQYPRYAVPLGLGLVECLENQYSELLDSNLIVPVPLFPSELKVATDPPGVKYNQSTELSKVVSSRLDMDFKEILTKTKVQKMRGLTRKQRKKAVKGLYKIKSKGRRDVENKLILLIDDVSTSGATASECAKVLIDAGAKMVNVLVAGRDTDVSDQA